MAEIYYDHKQAATALGLADRTFRAIINSLLEISEASRLSKKQKEKCRGDDPKTSRLLKKFQGDAQKEKLLAWAEKNEDLFHKLALTPEEAKEQEEWKQKENELFSSFGAERKIEPVSRDLYTESELLEVAKNLNLPFASRENGLLYPETRNLKLNKTDIQQALGLDGKTITKLLRDYKNLDDRKGELITREINTSPYEPAEWEPFACPLKILALYAMKYRLYLPSQCNGTKKYLPFPIYPDFADLYSEEEAKAAVQKSKVYLDHHKQRKYDPHYLIKGEILTPNVSHRSYYREEALAKYIHLLSLPPKASKEEMIKRPKTRTDYVLNAIAPYSPSAIVFKKLTQKDGKRENPVVMKHPLISFLLATDDPDTGRGDKEQKEILNPLSPKQQMEMAVAKYQGILEFYLHQKQKGIRIRNCDTENTLRELIDTPLLPPKHLSEADRVQLERSLSKGRDQLKQWIEIEKELIENDQKILSNLEVLLGKS